MAGKRIGTLTVGLFLVILGVLLLAHLIAGTNLPRILIEIWPVILIALGIEILYHHYHKGQDEKLRYDLVSMFVLFIVGIFSIGLFTLQASGLLDIIRTLPKYSSHHVDIGQQRIPVNNDIDRVIVENGLDNIRVRVLESDLISIGGSVRLMATSKNEARQLAEDDKGYSVRQQGKALIIETYQTDPGRLFLPRKIQNDPLEITVPASLALEIDSRWGNVDVIADKVEKDWFLKLSDGYIDVTLPAIINASITVDAGSITGDLDFKGQGENKAVSKDGTETPASPSVPASTRFHTQLGQGGPHLRLVNHQGAVAIYWK